MGKLNPVVFDYTRFNNIKEIILYACEKFAQNKAFIVKHKTVEVTDDSNKTKVSKDKENISYQFYFR